MVAQGRHIAQVHLTHKLYVHCTMLYTTLFCQKSDIATLVNPQIVYLRLPETALDAPSGKQC